ncbi:hypothetical protein [Corynebacterium pseudopelargi]|uniref:Uncharacterized protein n=1 Tax=Corynebacterium pseudopelargi TaxID=2080757 RepID=A0A3G6IYA1_9CORY|nr:hypothetical protein [Corynebacterium pseudopelargi]AZA08954.1 hypothetical protein CPPEL_04135 [Corynebacterium pseudopelargi]
MQQSITVPPNKEHSTHHITTQQERLLAHAEAFQSGIVLRLAPNTGVHRNTAEGRLRSTKRAPDRAAAVARLRLNDHHSAEFVHMHAPHIPLKVRTFQALGLSLTQAFELAADNAIARASTPSGLALRARPSALLTGQPSAGMQMDTPGSLPSGWLAHPHLHGIIHRHFSNVFGAAPVFFAPDHRTVLLSPTACPLLEHWISQRFGKVQPIRFPTLVSA